MRQLVRGVIGRITPSVKEIWHDNVLGGLVANFLFWICGSILSDFGSLAARWNAWLPTFKWASGLLATVGLLRIATIALFSRRQSAIFSASGEPYSLPRLSIRTRRCLGAAIVAAPAVAAIIVVGQSYFQGRLPEKIIILVANFDRQDPEYRVTRTIIENLESATKQFPNIRVEHLDRFLPWEQEEGLRVASEEAQKRKATIVLWGDYDKTSTTAKITFHFFVRNKGASSTLQLKNDSETIKVALSELESFTIQERISKQLGYLTFLVVGVARYSAGDNKGALSYFDSALRESEIPQELIDPDALYSYRGQAHFNLGEFDACIEDETEVRLSRSRERLAICSETR